MKIGYCVEGSTDRALLEALRVRWCPDATLIEGRFRGAFRRREIPKACFELQQKGVDLIVMLRDANDENWRDVLNGDQQCCVPAHAHFAVFGICDRNVECWLTTDRQYASARLGLPAQNFAVPDPKDIFESAMGISALERKEPEIVEFVLAAPLRNWLGNHSFENFYSQLRQKSKELGCMIENLLERS
jgi:hypothetical protein